MKNLMKTPEQEKTIHEIIDILDHVRANIAAKEANAKKNGTYKAFTRDEVIEEYRQAIQANFCLDD